MVGIQEGTGGEVRGRNPSHRLPPSPPFVPQLKPILSEIEYLQDQHLLLTVKSLDGYESYGTRAITIGPHANLKGLGDFGWWTPTLMVIFPLLPTLYPSGECVIALKSMIGSTAQQFLTYLSHRGEETGNIRGSMKVRVPAERLGTRERLYGESWGWQGCEEGAQRAPQPLSVPLLSSPTPSISWQNGSVLIRTKRQAAKRGAS